MSANLYKVHGVGRRIDPEAGLGDGWLSERAAAMALPDFLVIGAPKSGTTALHAALARHPQLYLSKIKEPKFFLCDGPPPHEGGPGDAHSYREWVWRRDDYERLFDTAPVGTLHGESTPLYLADVEAHRRIL